MKTALITALAVLAPSIAFADDPPDPEMQGPPTKSPDRSGPTVTFSVGPGEIHQVPDDGNETRSEGAAFSLRVGFTLSQVSTFDAVIDFVDAGSSLRSTIFGGTIKFYTNDPLYIRVGGGLGLISQAGSSDPMTGEGGGVNRYWGAAGIFAVGYEWFQLRDIGLFGEFEINADRIFDPSEAKTTMVNAAALVGITWY